MFKRFAQQKQDISSVSRSQAQMRADLLGKKGRRIITHLLFSVGLLNCRLLPNFLIAFADHR
jgi:hypothetical protein